MNLTLKVVILAILQGITEFLPVSSSGHLAVMGNLLVIPDSQKLLLTIVLHAGTLVAILLYYWRDLLDLLYPRLRWRIWGLGIVATIPVALTGPFLEKWLDSIFASARMLYFAAGCGFLASFIVLFFIFQQQASQVTQWEQMTWQKALLIGVAQIIAVMPGLSRSGTTIAAGTRVGCESVFATRFSFLMAIPVLAGAVVLKLPELYRLFSSGGHAQTVPLLNPGHLLLGFGIAAIVGYLSIMVLIRMLKRRTFRFFGFYCLLMALVSIVLGFTNA
ncbi:MAG: undecaprenyl-diphosphate phosphatase [Lentisphaerae bacterium]|nr:MAG: undecaprenyl-diphosphate phosphatase [Lentisphaerota bacterium]